MIPKERNMFSNPYTNEGRTTAKEVFPKCGQDKRRENRKAQRNKRK